LEDSVYRLNPVPLASVMIGLRVRDRTMTHLIGLGYAFRLLDNRVYQHPYMSEQVDCLPPACDDQRYWWDGGIILSYTIGFQIGSL
jgi:hypothetical protein